MAGSEVITHGQEVPSPINVAMQRRLLDRAKQLCAYFYGTMPATVMRQTGTYTAKWRRFNALTPNTTASTEIGASNADITFPTRTGSLRVTTTDYTAALQKFTAFSYYNEEVELYNYDNTTAEIADVFGELMGRTLNFLQRNEMEDNATQYFAAGAANVGTVATAVSGNDLDYITSQLNRNSAMKFFPESTGSQNFNTSPVRAAYVAIGHTDLEFDIRKLSGFIPREQYAGHTETVEGEIGARGRLRFILSEDATITTNSGVNVGSTGLINTGTKVDTYQLVIYGKKAFGSVGLDNQHISEIYNVGDNVPGFVMIKHAIGSAGAADPCSEIGSIGVKSFHAAKTLSPLDASNNTAWCRTLVCGATKLV